MTATQLIDRATALLGYRKAGMGLPQDVQNDGLDALNDLISNWRIQSLMVFSIADSTYTLIPSQQDYTIGPSGANFTAPRPAFIKEANLILNTSTPVIRVPIGILRDSNEWGNIRARTISSSIPLVLYYEPTVPNGILHFWPVPTTTYQAELFTWAQLTAFPDLTTTVNLAPGYENALKYNLAVEMAPTLPNKLTKVQGGRDLLALVTQKAARYVADLKSHNITPQRIVTDVAAMPSGAAYNRTNWFYLDGNLGGRR